MPPGQKDNNDNPKILGMGEEKAFDYFFRQYYSALSYFANNIIGDEEEARDIVQDTFIKLWNSQTISERSETVKSFLYTTARNKCVDVLRKRKTTENAQRELTERNPDPDCFDETAFAEMMRLLNDHLAELPLKVQQIIKLYYVDGKKYHEIASEVESTPEAVRKQKERALKILRRKF